MPQTLGERRVRTTFNPSNTNKVDQLKAKFAALIDEMQELRPGPDDQDAGEQHRLVSEAQTRIEDAAHWAVKAATTGIGR